VMAEIRTSVNAQTQIDRRVGIEGRVFSDPSNVFRIAADPIE
jgi:hypothetical protein